MSAAKRPLPAPISRMQPPPSAPKHLSALPRDAAAEQSRDFRRRGEIAAGSELVRAGAVVTEPRRIQRELHVALETDPTARRVDFRGNSLAHPLDVRALQVTELGRGRHARALRAQVHAASAIRYRCRAWRTASRTRSTTKWSSSPAARDASAPRSRACCMLPGRAFSFTIDPPRGRESARRGAERRARGIRRTHRSRPSSRRGAGAADRGRGRTFRPARCSDQQRLEVSIRHRSARSPGPAWDDLIGSNLRAPLFLAQAAAPQPREAARTHHQYDRHPWLEAPEGLPGV